MVAIGRTEKKEPTNEDPQCTIPTMCYWSGWGEEGAGGQSPPSGGGATCSDCGPSAPQLVCTSGMRRKQTVSCEVSNAEATTVQAWRFRSERRTVVGPSSVATWSGPAVEGGSVSARVGTNILQTSFAVAARPWGWGTVQWSYSQGTGPICDSKIIAEGVMLGWNVNPGGDSACLPDNQVRVSPDPRRSDGFTVGQVPSGPNAGVFYVDTATYRMDRASNMNPQAGSAGTALTLTGSQATACGATASFSQFNTCKGVSMPTFTASVWGHEGTGYSGGRGHETVGRTAAAQPDNDPYKGIEPFVSDSAETQGFFATRIRNEVWRRAEVITVYASDKAENVGGNWSGSYWVWSATTAQFIQISQSF